MKKIGALHKFKGLKNGKDWESGNLKIYDNDLAAIYRETSHFYVFKDSISLFTGFVNTSGEELYEGDLIAYKGGSQGKTWANVIFWDKESKEWKVGASPEHDPLLCHPLRECLDHAVVGHVFTHQYMMAASEDGLYRSTQNEANP